MLTGIAGLQREEEHLRHSTGRGPKTGKWQKGTFRGQDNLIGR